jgi:tRNA(Arg) A34 adenosine deaminase TadA
MEPCLMCLTRAYWGGIRKIVYVIEKEKVDSKTCYESPINQIELAKSFNEEIELIHLEELEDEALKTYNNWQTQQ